MSFDLAILLIRVVFGLTVAAHGAQKLFGSFGGYGIKGIAGWLGSMGFRPALLWAWLAGLTEFGGGLLMALGFLGPIGALGVIYTIGPWLLPRLVPILHRRAPEMPLLLEENYTHRLLEKLKAQQGGDGPEGGKPKIRDAVPNAPSMLRAALDACPRTSRKENTCAAGTV